MGVEILSTYLSTEEAFAAGKASFGETAYVSAIYHLEQVINSEGDLNEAALPFFVYAYERLGQWLDFAKVDWSAIGKEEQLTYLDRAETERIAKLIAKRGSARLISLITQLAESTLLDAAFVAKQSGRKRCTPLFAAFLYYTQSNKRLKPNVYFDPRFYQVDNEVTLDIDPVEHYFNHRGGRLLRTHRLFDTAWLSTVAPQIQTAECPLTFYWTQCYPKGISICNPEQVRIEPSVRTGFFMENSAPGITAALESQAEAANLPESVRPLYRYFAALDAVPRFIPIDFTVEGYLELHKDLADSYAEATKHALAHYLAYGLKERRPYSLDDLFGYRAKPTQLYEKDRLATITHKKPLCILTHLYYPDLWPELRRYINNAKVEHDLYINLVDSTWSPAVVAEIRATHPHARILISPNEGRDIGGYLNLLRTIELDDYLAFATIHSKKSQHISEKHMVAWRTNLLDAILGSPEKVENNLAALASDPTVGIIGSVLHRETDIGDNEQLYVRLLDEFTISKVNRECEYVSGTMMLMRSSIMRAVYEKAKGYSFNNADGKSLDFLVDGQIEHALERLFGNVMKQLGCRFMWV